MYVRESLWQIEDPMEQWQCGGGGVPALGHLVNGSETFLRTLIPLKAALCAPAVAAKNILRADFGIYVAYFFSYLPFYIYTLIYLYICIYKIYIFFSSFVCIFILWLWGFFGF